MRLGIVLPRGGEAEVARAAEAHGLFGVVAGLDDPITSVTAAVYASTSTEFVRVVTVVRLANEHPITVAEELAVLDNVNNGRTIVAVDPGGLEEEAAVDEISVLREALACRPIQHIGARWRVPAGLPDNAGAPTSISVTPKPPQAEIPFWIVEAKEKGLSKRVGLPGLMFDQTQVTDPPLVQPAIAIAKVGRDLDANRRLVSSWAAVGATHLFLQIAIEDAQAMLTLISRFLAPEVAMPNFPRVMSDAQVPLPWPGDG